MKPLFAEKPSATLNTRPAEMSIDLSPVTHAVAPRTAPAPRAASLPVAPRITETQIGALGTDAATGLSNIPNRLIASVRAADAGDFGSGLSQLVSLAKGLDPSAKQKGLISKVANLFGSAKERMLSQYRTVEQQMDQLMNQLQQKATTHLARIDDLEQMYVANMQYHQQLENAVAKCDEYLVELRAYIAAAGAPTDAFAAQQLADVQRMADRADKRGDDLRRAMLLAKQNAPQIRTMQDNARMLVDKFADIRAVTLPAWKNTFGLYLMGEEQREAVALTNSIDNATDDALRRGASMLRQNTAEIATARQRSVVSTETLSHIQSELLGALDDANRIAADGIAARQRDLSRLASMESELVQRFAPGQR